MRQVDRTSRIVALRILLSTDKTDELIREYVADGGKPEEWWKSWAGAYSVAPTQDAPIVRDRGEGRILELVRWDWQKPANRPKGAPIINARMEKVCIPN